MPAYKSPYSAKTRGLGGLLLLHKIRLRYEGVNRDHHATQNPSRDHSLQGRDTRPAPSDLSRDVNPHAHVIVKGSTMMSPQGWIRQVTWMDKFKTVRVTKWPSYPCITTIQALPHGCSTAVRWRPHITINIPVSHLPRGWLFYCSLEYSRVSLSRLHIFYILGQFWPLSCNRDQTY